MIHEELTKEIINAFYEVHKIKLARSQFIEYANIKSYTRKSLYNQKMKEVETMNYLPQSVNPFLSSLLLSKSCQLLFSGYA